MTFVYLDQCAVGCLAERESPLWEEIRGILEDGFKAERIVCPFPTETLFETAHCDRELRMGIEAFFSKVSGGYRFRDFGERVVDNSIALVRPDFEVEPLAKINFHGWAGRDDIISSLKQIRDHGRESISNIFSQHVYPPEAKSMSLEALFRSAAMDRNDMLQRDLCLFLKGVSSREKFEIPWLLEGLIQHRMSNCEAERLRDAAGNGTWGRIMENELELLLVSQWNYEIIQGSRKKHDSNDEIDRWRAVVGLSCAELFVTDKSAAAHCRGVALLAGLPTKVIAVNRPKEIIGFLQSVQ